MVSAGQRRGAVIVAAGSGDRFGDSRKVLREVAGQPLLLHSVHAFGSIPTIERIVVVLGAHTLEDGSRALRQVRACGAIIAVTGGATRSESVRAGLEATPDAIDLVAVHDAARPLVTPEMIESVFAAGERTGAAVPALPVTDTLVQVDGDGCALAGTLDRSRVRAVQTPQVARRDWLTSALTGFPDETDEGSALFRAGYPVELVAGDPRNVKVTWPDDLQVVEMLLGRSRLS